MTPLVTFLVPAFNPSSRWLEDAVASALAQTESNIEVIVVDDGSDTDVVGDVCGSIKDRRLRWLRKENGGKASAMNLGLAVDRGEYTAVMDADDLSSPRRAEVVLAAFSESDDALLGVMSGYHLVINGKSYASRCHPRDTRECRLLGWNMILPSHDPTLVFRTRVGQAVGFDESLRIGQGIDFVLRLLEMGELQVIGEDLYGYRIHSGSITRQDAARRRQFVELVADKAWARRGFVERTRLGATSESPDNHLHRHFMRSVAECRDRGELRGAVVGAVTSIMRGPLLPRYYLALANLLFPRTLRNWLRSD